MSIRSLRLVVFLSPDGRGHLRAIVLPSNISGLSLEDIKGGKLSRYAFFIPMMCERVREDAPEGPFREACPFENEQRARTQGRPISLVFHPLQSR